MVCDLCGGRWWWSVRGRLRVHSWNEKDDNTQERNLVVTESIISPGNHEQITVLGGVIDGLHYQGVPGCTT